MVPIDWKTQKIAKAGVQVIDGDRGTNYPKASDFFEDEYCLFLSAKNVTKNGFKFDERQFITKEKCNAMSKGLLTRGDIVLTTRGTVGNIALYKDEIPYESVRINSGMLILRNTNGSISNDYLYKLLRSPVVDRQFDRLAFGSAQPQLTVQTVKSLDLPLPPLPEQKKIAQILSAWDMAIETVGKLIENSQKQKKWLMQNLLTGKKRLPGFRGEWEEGTLSKMASITMGQSPAGETYNTDGKGLPLLNGPTEFTERYPVKKQWTYSPTKICNPGDVLLCVRGSSTGRMNKSDDTYCIGRGIAAISSNKNGVVEFIEHLLVHITDIIISMTSGSTFPNIDKKTLGSIKVSIPPLDEQKAIAKVLSVNDRTTEGLEELRDQYQFQKKALMQQLLTGKRRVRVSE